MQGHCDVVYTSSRYQVRLWHVEPGEPLANFPVLGQSQSTFSQSQCFLITGTITVTDADGSTWAPERGRRFVFTALESKMLENTGSARAIILELLWGEHLEQLPLPDATEVRPWGNFTVLKDEALYKLKALQVNPGSRLSLQRHFKREEHWLVTQGRPDVFLDDVVHSLKSEDYIHIPLQSWHRITNSEQATEVVEIIELQLGEYFGEDDIERRQDDYGRA